MDTSPLLDSVARCEIGGRGLKLNVRALPDKYRRVARCEIGGRGLKQVPLVRLFGQSPSPAVKLAGVD